MGLTCPGCLTNFVRLFIHLPYPLLHTLLFVPGLWQSSGRYWSTDGYETQLRGQFLVSHLGADDWHIRINAITQDSENDVLWETWYHAPAPGQHRFRFRAHSSVFGPNEGLIVIRPDSLHWRYRIPSIAMKGTDVYRRVSDDQYEMEGVLGSNGIHVVSRYHWQFRRVGEAPQSSR